MSLFSRAKANTFSLAGLRLPTNRSRGILNGDTEPFGAFSEEEIKFHAGRGGKRGGASWYGGRTGRRRIIKLFLLLLISSISIFFYLYELHVELQLYSKGWIRRTIMPTPPLSSTCFNLDAIAASAYNTTLASSPSYVELHSGIEMRLGRDCFDFASTIPSTPMAGMILADHTVYHTYWRADLRPLGKRQISLLQSILATQDRESTSVILWTNAETTAHILASPLIVPLATLYGNRFEVRSVDKAELSRGTPMEGHAYLDLVDGRAWLDGDLVRLLVLWRNGGIWVDMDTILTGRDMRVLGEKEWITQWDCYGKIYQPLNGAMMHFFKESPYVCEFLHTIATSPLPRPGSTDWGSILYHQVFRRLIANSIPPFKILPYCFTDGVSCRLDNRLPDPFARKDVNWGKGKMEDLKRRIESVFAVHLHGKWEKDFPKDGYIKRLILDGVNERIKEYRLKKSLGEAQAKIKMRKKTTSPLPLVQPPEQLVIPMRKKEKVRGA